MAFPLSGIRGAKRLGARPYVLNRESELAQGLGLYWPMGDWPFDLVRNYPLTMKGTVTTAFDGYQSSSLTSGAATVEDGWSSTILPSVQTDNFTMAIWTTLSFYVSTENIAMNYGDVSTGWAIELFTDFQILINGIVRVDSGVAVAPYSTPKLLGLRRLNTVWQMFIDGRFVGSTSTTNPNTPATGVQVGWQSGFLRPWDDGTMASAAFWTRPLSDSEVWSLYAPQTRWDLYWQPSNRAYSFMSAAAAAAGYLLVKN